MSKLTIHRGPVLRLRQYWIIKESIRVIFQSIRGTLNSLIEAMDESKLGT